jgi:hypothetical protein
MGRSPYQNEPLQILVGTRGLTVYVIVAVTVICFVTRFDLVPIVLRREGPGD